MHAYQYHLLTFIGNYVFERFLLAQYYFIRAFTTSNSDMSITLAPVTGYLKVFVVVLGIKRFAFLTSPMNLIQTLQFGVLNSPINKTRYCLNRSGKAGSIYFIEGYGMIVLVKS